MEGSVNDLSKYRFESARDDLESARLREKADYQDFVIISKEQRRSNWKRQKRS